MKENSADNQGASYLKFSGTSPTPIIIIFFKEDELCHELKKVVYHRSKEVDIN